MKNKCFAIFSVLWSAISWGDVYNLNMLIRAKKSLGQNFLVNPHILDKIISAAEISKDDIILEVGPGTGLLTKKLAEKAKRVIAVEKDGRLIPVLQETFKNYPNVEIIEADVLKLTRAALVIQGPPLYKIVANIPYYITSNFLRTVFEKWPTPILIVLTIQKEVAQRIMVKPPSKSSEATSGQAHMNLLALSVQYYSEPEIIGYISKNNFYPVPKVNSAIIKLRSHDKYQILNYKLQTNSKPQIPNTKQEKELFNFIRAGFSEKRKQLASVLSKKLKISKNETGEALKKIGVPLNARAENLSLDQWILLKNILAI